MARRSNSGGILRRSLWAALVLSVSAAFIGDPTQGLESYTGDLIARSHGFKKFIHDVTTFDGWGEGDPSIDIAVPDRDLAVSDSDLDAIKVAPEHSMATYSRDDWNHWIDVRPCWTVREQVLARDAEKGSLVMRTSNGTKTTSTAKACSIVSGRWVDRYTGKTLTAPADLDIDHMVALAAAHRSGGLRWSAAKREKYANYLKDPDHLVAVSASANREKGDKTPAAWKPANKGSHCWYATAWVRVKKTWDLSMTPAEKKAVAAMLTTCKH